MIKYYKILNFQLKIFFHYNAGYKNKDMVKKITLFPFGQVFQGPY
jgi:hypothetical protein